MPTSLSDPHAGRQPLEQALICLQQTRVSVLAGGTDFYPALGNRPAPDDVMAISMIEGLRYIRRDPDAWVFGAATTWSDVQAGELPAAFDGLRAAAREVGSVQIQNTATLAGNLCTASPAADGMPALLALNASVELASLHGTRRLPLAEFVQGPRQTALRSDELLTAIRVPLPELPVGGRVISHFRKLGSRCYLVISIAMLAVTIVIDDQHCITSSRVAVGACSPVALRLSELEQALVGLTVGRGELAARVSSRQLTVLSPISDVRGSAAYRLRAVEVLLRQVLQQIDEASAAGAP